MATRDGHCLLQLGSRLSTGSGLMSQMSASGVAPSGAVADQCIAADFNADGRTDIACLSASSSSTWSVGSSSGSAFTTQSRGGGSTVTAPVSTNCIPGDFNLRDGEYVTLDHRSLARFITGLRSAAVQWQTRSLDRAGIVGDCSQRVRRDPYRCKIGRCRSPQLPPPAPQLARMDPRLLRHRRHAGPRRLRRRSAAASPPHSSDTDAQPR
jgi:hypothetical protein